MEAGFLTYTLCHALTDAVTEVMDEQQLVNVQYLHGYLKVQAKEHQTDPISVPCLYGNGRDFALLKVTQVISGQQAQQQQHHHQTLERYRQLMMQACDIVDLANQPEDRDIVSRKLELRQLYVSLRMRVEFSPIRKAEIGYSAPELIQEVMLEDENPSSEKFLEEIEQHRQKQFKLYGQVDDTRKRVSLGERLTQNQQVVILGDPGAGKTTLLRWLTTAYLLRLKDDPAWEQMPDVETLPEQDWLPILIRCRDLTREQLATSCLDDILGFALRKTELSPDDATALQEALREQLQDGPIASLPSKITNKPRPIIRLH